MVFLCVSAKGESPWRWQQGFIGFGLNLWFLFNRCSFKGGRLSMRRCALRAIVRLRGTECIAVCILLPRTALAIARLVRGYWGFSPVGAGSGMEKNTIAKSQSPQRIPLLLIRNLWVIRNCRLLVIVRKWCDSLLVNSIILSRCLLPLAIMLNFIYTISIPIIWPCKTVHLALRNGPFRNAKRPVLEREVACIGNCLIINVL